MALHLKESTAVQTHIMALQNIITRMGNNSANCKTWSVTLVAAILVLLADKSKADFFWISYIPLGLFWLLDAFYLGLEKHFRDCHTNFLKALNSKHFDFSLIYEIPPPKAKLRLTGRGLSSFATSPFYLLLSGMILLTFCLVKGR